MDDKWQYQVRITASPELAANLRADPAGSSYGALDEILRRHGASLKCQFDAFAEYVLEAENSGPENYALYEWTRDTLGDPVKKAKYLRSFTVYVNGNQVYAGEIASLLHAELSAIADRIGIEGVVKYDTNPATNPQPPRRGS